MPSNNNGNIFDKIFKQNAESIFLPFVETYLGSKIVQKQVIKDKIQATVEREVDFIYNVVLANGSSFLLHIEFQSVNETNMIYRMAEYHGFFVRKYKKEIRHFVIYLGNKPSTMTFELPANQVFNSFQLVNVCSLDSDKFLNSQIPEELILAVLSKYPKKDTETILQLVITKLKKIVKNKSLLSKYTKQLIFISRLREAEGLTTKILNDMPVIYDIQKDFLYNKGIEKGIEKEKVDVILKGHQNGISVSLLSNITSLNEAQVKAIIKNGK